MAQIILDHVDKTYAGPAGYFGKKVILADTRHLQFFDPGSGLSIGHPKASAALAD